MELKFTTCSRGFIVRASQTLTGVSLCNKDLVKLVKSHLYSLSLISLGPLTYFIMFLLISTPASLILSWFYLISPWAQSPDSSFHKILIQWFLLLFLPAFCSASLLFSLHLILSSGFSFQLYFSSLSDCHLLFSNLLKTSNFFVHCSPPKFFDHLYNLYLEPFLR